MNSKIIAAIVIALVLIGGGVGGYVYYTHTPTYTLSLIKDAIDNHNWEEFSRHVDVENMVSKAFDDFMTVDTSKNDEKNLGSDLAVGVMNMMKPALVAKIVDEAKQAVKVGKTSNSEKSDNNVEFDKDIFKKLNFDNIPYVHKSGNMATIGLSEHDNDLERNFTLEFTARQLDDGTWQVLEIANLKEYIAEVKKAQEEKLAKINEPIIKKMNSIVVFGKVVAEMKSDSWGISKVLKFTVPVTVKSDKTVDKIEGKINIKTDAGKTFDIPFEMNLDMANGNKTTSIGKELNPFIPNEDNLSKVNFATSTITLTTEKMTFADATVLEKQKSLKPTDKT